MSKIIISLEDSTDITISNTKIIHLEKEITSYSTTKYFSNIYRLTFSNNKFKIYNLKGSIINVEFPLSQFKKYYKEFLEYEKQFDSKNKIPNDKNLANICIDEIKTGYMYFVMNENYDILGFSSIYRVKYNHIKIRNLFVGKEFRNKGIATELLEFGEKYLGKKYNSKIIDINVYRENIKAFELYRKFGFKEV